VYERAPSFHLALSPEDLAERSLRVSELDLELVADRKFTFA